MDFISLCAKGLADLDEINDYIDAWHTSPSNPLHLHTFLGMSLEDYNIWMFNPAYLTSVVKDRKEQLNII